MIIYTLTGLSNGSDAVMGFTVGISEVTDADARFFSKHFTWFLIVFYLATEEIFILFKKCWIITIRHPVIFTFCYIIYESL